MTFAKRDEFDAWETTIDPARQERGIWDQTAAILGHKHTGRNEMKPTGGYVYADQKAAEERVNELRGSLSSLIETLEEVNETVDSFKLARVIENSRFKLGI